MDKVFVYGTLKKGRHFRSTVFGDQEPIIASIPNVGLFESYYPAAKDVPNAVIYGEVYEVDGELLTQLDDIEGHPNFYERVKRLAKDNDGEFYDVWIYFNESLCDLENFNSTGIYD